MKKIACGLLATSALMLGGCNSRVDRDDRIDQDYNVRNQNQVTKGITRQGTTTSIGNYDGFERVLHDNNINYIKKTAIENSAFGAVEGYRYTYNGNNYEVYRFENMDYSSLGTLLNNERNNNPQFGHVTYVEDNFIIVAKHDVDHSDNFINVFKGRTLS